MEIQPLDKHHTINFSHMSHYDEWRSSHIMVVSFFWAGSLLYNYSPDFRLLYTPFFLIFLYRVTTQKISINATIASLIIAALIATKITISGLSIDVRSLTSFEPISFIYAIPFLLFIKNDIQILSINRERLLKLVNIISSTLLVILVLDTILRIKNCELSLSTYSACKLNGIFPTSNVSGLISGFLALLYLIYLRKYMLWFIFLIITLLSFSRSAIFLLLMISIIIITIYNYKGIGIITTILTGFFIASAYSNIDLLVNYIQHDGSFNSKYQIVENVFYNFPTYNHALIFGGNLDHNFAKEIVDLNNWSPHLSFLKAFIYFGVIGLAAWIILHVYIYNILSRKGKVIFLYLMIISLFGSPIFNTALLLLILADKAYYSHSFYSHIKPARSTL